MSDRLTKSDRDMIEELIDALEEQGASLNDIRMESSDVLFSPSSRAVEFEVFGRIVYQHEGDERTDDD